MTAETLGSDLDAAAALIADAIVCDHTLPYVGPSASEIAAHKQAGYGFVSITIAADFEPSNERMHARLAREQRFYASADVFRLAGTVADIEAANAEGKLAIGFHLQGTEPIQRNLDNVWLFKAAGLSFMLLAYNWQNNAAVGCLEAEERDVGLSLFGRDLIDEMNAAGVIVDLSHTGKRCTLEAIDRSQKPPFFSHSNVRALHDHPRNIDTEQIRAVTARGGIIGVTGVGEFTGPAYAAGAPVTAGAVFAHIDAIAQLAGPESVGLGLDYMSPLTCEKVLAVLGGDLSRVGMSKPPWPFLHPSALPELVLCMQKAGYPRDAILGILGGNFLRFAKTWWDE